MARQSTTPVSFNRTTRRDRVVGMTSGRAGVVVPIDFIPLLRGDSCAGQFNISMELGEMPKPLLNAVGVNLQAWFVPKSAYPYFSGYDEFMYSYQKEDINSLDGVRTPPEFFRTMPSNLGTFQNSDMMIKLGLHDQTVEGDVLNGDLFDAYNLIWNFRAGAHSSKIERASYFNEPNADRPANRAWQALKPAFWPSGRMNFVVPDYERALVVGALDLDVQAGSLKVRMGDTMGGVEGASNLGVYSDPNDPDGDTKDMIVASISDSVNKQLWADLQNETLPVSLAEIDKARLTQSFAKRRAQMAGNDYSGFDPDDVIVAELMQGFSVPRELFQRPWLLDSKRLTFGMMERFATDAANLDQSVSVGKTGGSLSLNVPVQDTGGYIMITCEVLPEKLNERMGEPTLYLNDPDMYPNALRDIQRPEPVDYVPNWRIDARHTSPDALYGYEPMNGVWERDFTRLGGDFYQPDPSVPFKESRAGIWTPNIVDPTLNDDHWLAPDPFPHDVFSDTVAEAFEIAFSHSVAINGITQIGDVLVENNDDYEAVASEVDSNVSEE
mgnify:CR=1 FL=1